MAYETMELTYDAHLLIILFSTSFLFTFLFPTVLKSFGDKLGFCSYFFLYMVSWATTFTLPLLHLFRVTDMTTWLFDFVMARDD